MVTGVAAQVSAGWGLGPVVEGSRRLHPATTRISPTVRCAHPPCVCNPCCLPPPLPPIRSVLLKDSFVDSFPPRDRPFMRQFAETQMFSVYTDAVLG